VRNVANKLMSAHEEYLSTWVIHNYIGQCAQLCPVYISRLFNDVNTTVKLKNAVSAIVHRRLSRSQYELWQAVVFAELFIPANVSMFSLTVNSCVFWLNELAKIDKRLLVYFKAVALLHVASKISRNCFNDKLMDILATILRSNLNQCCGALTRCKTK